MADTKITDLGALTASASATGDLVPLVDVSDTTMSADGTNKAMTMAELRTWSSALSSAKSPTINTVGATGSAETISWATEVHDLTMDQACTFSFSNVPTSGTFGSIVVIIRGAFTPTLPAAVDWNAGTPPTYTSPSMYVFSSVDGGTVVLGSQVGSAFS